MSFRITIDAVQGPQVVTPAVQVTLGVTTPSLITSYLWELITPSAASAAVLDSTTAAGPKFTPDVEGSYKINCQILVNGITQFIGTYAEIDFERTGLRVPAPQETVDSGDDDRGWHNARYDQLLQFDRMAALGATVICKNNAGVAIDIGSVIRIDDTWTASAGAFTGRRMPDVVLATEDDVTPVDNEESTYGVVVSAMPDADENVTSGTVAAGASCLVCVYGLVDNALFDGAVALTEGKAVGVGSTAGKLAIDEASSARNPIGKILYGFGTRGAISIGAKPENYDTTSNATPAIIWTMLVDENKAYRIDAEVIAFNDDGSEAGTWNLSGAVRRDAGGNVTLVETGRRHFCCR